jgi:hypothetical protein
MYRFFECACGVFHPIGFEGACWDAENCFTPAQIKVAVDAGTWAEAQRHVEFADYTDEWARRGDPRDGRAVPASIAIALCRPALDAARNVLVPPICRVEQDALAY